MSKGNSVNKPKDGRGYKSTGRNTLPAEELKSSIQVYWEIGKIKTLGNSDDLKLAKKAVNKLALKYLNEAYSNLPESHK